MTFQRSRFVYSHSSAVGFGLALLALSFFGAACSDDDGTTPFDAGPRRDGGDGIDAAVDGEVPLADGEVPMRDGAAADGAATDGGFDAGFVRTDGGLGCSPSDRCPCPAPGIDCASASCPSGTACFENGCGDMRCKRTGAVCDTDADCPSSSTCTSTALGSACIASGSGCADSRECPRGFACEAGSCVDRRVPCEEGADCPWGFYCRTDVTSEGRYCEYIARACDSLDVCSILGDCVDVDADGDTECRGDSLGGCSTNADCTAPSVCSTDGNRLARCGMYGPCAGTCPSGFECVDLFGDGQRECVPTGGTCTSSADCPARQVCAAPRSGGPPECVAGLP